MEIEKFIERYPTLYHMAERDSWPSIRARGLLSTTASLDRAAVTAAQRQQLESRRRHSSVEVTLNDAATLVLRDQKPMSDARLANCLLNGITPFQWYEFINGKSFFWATKERLQTLLAAYGDQEHDVLFVDTESLVNVHAHQMWLCHMNSGNTTPWAHPRNYDIFKRIADYPVTATGRPAKQVAEVVVDYSVPDIAEHVRKVIRMQAQDVTDENPYP